jgi:hypothetical protein
LKGHGFSRAAEQPNEIAALAAEGMQVNKNELHQGLKPKIPFAQLSARLKPCPFKTGIHSDGSLLSGWEKTGQTSLTAACLAALVLSALLLAAGCHSYHVETTVENRTGGAIQLLEVDYPSASFGANSLAAEAIFHYRIQLRGSGPVKVQYTAGDGRPVQIDGPMLAEPQQGQLQIVLLPAGKAEFHPQLTP